MTIRGRPQLIGRWAALVALGRQSGVWEIDPDRPTQELRSAGAVMSRLELCLPVRPMTGVFQGAAGIFGLQMDVGLWVEREHGGLLTGF